MPKLQDPNTWVGKTFTDDQSREITLAGVLGHGGQGSVFRTDHPKLVAKVVEIGSDDSARRNAWTARLRRVARLGVDGLAITTPESFFHDADLVGYAMRLMDDMVPIKRLAARPRNVDALAWYHETGGQRRRLVVLAELADVLAGLHQRGLAYGDVSLTNLFVSEDVEGRSAWLIDSDNLVFSSSPLDSIAYTPGYAAPEVMRGEAGVSTQTDAFAFAVVLFEVLTLQHPLLGDDVLDGDPDLEEAAFRGELPWIDDPADPRNRTAKGLSRTVTLTPALRDLLQATFGPGLRDPDARPSVAQFAGVLHRAAGTTIACDDGLGAGCRGWFSAAQALCPWCNAPRRRDLVVSKLGYFALTESRQTRGSPPSVNTYAPTDTMAMVASGGHSSRWTRNHVFGDYGELGNQDLVSIEVLSHGVRARAGDGVEVWYSKALPFADVPAQDWAKEMRRLTRPTVLERGYLLHLGPADQSHPIVRL